LTGRHVSSSVNGTDFSYEDLEQLYGTARDGSWTRLDDVELDGSQVYVLESVSNAGTPVTYPRITMYIDKNSCVIMKMKLFGSGGRVRKVFSAIADSVRQIEGYWIAHKMVMRDKRNMTETKLLVHKVNVETDFPDEVFDPGYLKDFKPQ
jgi:hypothetical protein